MNRLYRDHIVPKYVSGRWSWTGSIKEILYTPWETLDLKRRTELKVNGLKFKATINQIEEDIFRQEFTRPDNTFDADVILIQDIKNLVFFLAPSEILSCKLISLFHTKTVDSFLNALIIYFEYFLRLVEFTIIRRDETAGQNAQIEDLKSIEIKRVYSKYLSEYRLILAREYSPILRGTDDMKPFHHLGDKGKISHLYADSKLHEGFRAICTQIVWIAHHRRAHDVIEDEMNRLFCSEHFKLNKYCPLKLKPTERELLFGKKCKHVNFRYQNSPLIQEITNVPIQYLPLLWIGHKKYRGNDLRIQQLEIEIIIPESQLVLANLTHGILGHPKYLYNTLFELNWDEVRQVFSENYDPYHLVVQPRLELPNLDEVKLEHLQAESYFLFKNNRYEYTPELIEKWKRRDRIIEYIMKDDLLLDVVAKCRKEIEQIGKNEVMSSKQKTAEFIALKQKLLKG